MATIKIVLNKSQHQRKVKSNQSMLMMRYTHKKEVTYFTTHKNLDDKFWDEKGQCIKRACPGSERANIYLKIFRQKLEDVVNGLLIKGEDPTTHYVKNLYSNDEKEKQLKKQYTLFEYAEHYIEISKKHKGTGTIITYQNTINKLRQYENYARITLDWHHIDMDFYYDFFEFYTGIEGLTNNGFGKVIKILKVFLNDATEKGYNTNKSYQHKGFKVLREDVNNIYLSEQEIAKIINLDLTQDKSLERVRDLFVFGCYTGLRYSDFSRVKPEHIVGDTLRIKTIKTNEWVTIPLVSIVKTIMEKYSHSANSLPKSCVNQTMNRHLKDIGELAKINDKILKIRNKGTQRIEESFLKYELICTHTARRSFATNMFKKGIPSRVIMNITGHRTEKAFSSYIKITQDENAELMLKYLKESA